MLSFGLCHLQLNWSWRESLSKKQFFPQVDVSDGLQRKITKGRINQRKNGAGWENSQAGRKCREYDNRVQLTNNSMHNYLSNTWRDKCNNLGYDEDQLGRVLDHLCDGLLSHRIQSLIDHVAGVGKLTTKAMMLRAKEHNSEVCRFWRNKQQLYIRTYYMIQDWCSYCSLQPMQSPICISDMRSFTTPPSLVTRRTKLLESLREISGDY